MAYSLIQIREYLKNNSFSLDDLASWDGRVGKISQILISTSNFFVKHLLK